MEEDSIWKPLSYLENSYVCVHASTCANCTNGQCAIDRSDTASNFGFNLRHHISQISNHSCLVCRNRNAGNISLIKLNCPFSDSADIQLFAHLWKHAVVSACADGGANILHDCLQLNHGEYLPSFISGDFDSIRAEVLEFYQKKSCEVIVTSDQNATDFTKCLRLVVQKLKDINTPCEAIFVHAGNDGRLDHVMANINTLYEAKKVASIPVYLITSSSLTFLLPSGKNVINVKCSKRGPWCSLIPVGNPSLHVTTSGLRYNLDDQRMCFGDLISTSNTFTESPVVHVEADQPLLWSMGLNL